MESSHVNFKPFVGKHYKEGFGPQKDLILVLGESFPCRYRKECGDCTLENCRKMGFPDDEFSEAPTKTVQYYLDDRSSNQTFLCFERSVLGKDTTLEESEVFWSHLAFYNFFQKCFMKEDGARTCPEFGDWDYSEEAFKEVLANLNPDKIIVWGCRLYDFLPDWDGSGTIISCGEGKTDVWTYDLGGKKIPCMKIYHPSTPLGKSRDYWHQFYKVFLGLEK